MTCRDSQPAPHCGWVGLGLVHIGRRCRDSFPRFSPFSNSPGHLEMHPQTVSGEGTLEIIDLVHYCIFESLTLARFSTIIFGNRLPTRRLPPLFPYIYHTFWNRKLWGAAVGTMER